MIQIASNSEDILKSGNLLVYSSHSGYPVGSLTGLQLLETLHWRLWNDSAVVLFWREDEK